MDNRENDLFGDDLTFNKKKIDDFSHVKDNTMDFLKSERSEKVDTTEKIKEAAVDDFLNFHDDIGDEKGDFSPNHFSSNNPVLLPTIEKKEEVKQPEIDFNLTTDDDYLNPYAMNKSLNDTTNEKFISSEDLLTDFKDPIETEKKKEVPEVPKFIEEPPKEIPVFIPPPVETKKEPVEEPKPKEPEVVAPVKPKEPEVVAPAPSVKSSTPPPLSSNDTQIEAEKIFKSIGLG